MRSIAALASASLLALLLAGCIAPETEPSPGGGAQANDANDPQLQQLRAEQSDLQQRMAAAQAERTQLEAQLQALQEQAAEQQAKKAAAEQALRDAQAQG
jgi:septal ring factor EnvC (AmiA/AmiB activator)